MTLVQQLMAYNRQERPSQGVILRPDMDVQLQIEDNVDTFFRVHHKIINTRYVKGHQDETGRTLILAEKLNVMADELASESRYRTKPQPHHFPSQVAGLRVDSHQITTKYKDTLKFQWAMHGTHQMHKYISEKYGWTDTQMGHVNWHCTPAKNMGIGKRIFIASYSYKRLPLNVKLNEKERDRLTYMSNV